MNTDTTVLPSRRHTETTHGGRTAAPCVGTLVAADAGDGVTVRFPGRPSDAPVPARSTVPLTPKDTGRSVLLVFERGHAERPIITGLIEEEPVQPSAAATGEAVVLPHDPSQTVRVDGRRLHFTAGQEVVIECGQSSIRLRADGRIVILGTEIVSRARRTHKVKGGNVLIN
jgi:hypothetical protein